MLAIILVLFGSVIAAGQEPEATISKDAVSVHRVERGTMPLRERAAGTVGSITPPTASVVLSSRQREVVRAGHACSVEVAPAKVIGCKVDTIEPGSDTVARLLLSGPLPSGTAVRAALDALIDVGQATDVVFLERPASAEANTESTIFVIEPDGEHARRVAVKYGRQSGSLIEVLAGLTPGDRVIVTDTSAAAGRDRVRLK